MCPAVQVTIYLVLFRVTCGLIVFALALPVRFEEFFIPGPMYEDTSLSLSEQLYTIRGSQGAAMSTGYDEAIGASLHSTFLVRQEHEVAGSDQETLVDGVFGGDGTATKEAFLRPMHVVGLVDAGPVLPFSEYVLMLIQARRSL